MLVLQQQQLLQTLGHGAVLGLRISAWKGAVQVPVVAVVQQDHRPSPAQLASCHTQSPLQAACRPPGCPQSATVVVLVLSVCTASPGYFASIFEY